MACCGETGRPDEGLLAREDARAPRRHGRVAFQRAAPIHRERVALHGARLRFRTPDPMLDSGAVQSDAADNDCDAMIAMTCV